jgi:16S rRNA (uracil1498-N3)-methyltransferase
MPRFPVSRQNINNNVAVISGSDYRHITKVLRLKAGDDVVLFDAECYEHYGKITEIGSRQLTVEIAESRRVNTDSPLNITLLQGMPKAGKMDYIVEKATELGVHTIVPVITERSQVRTSDKQKRWDRIATEASKQCGRTKPTVIENTLDFEAVIKRYDNNTLRIIFHINYDISIKEFLKDSLQFPRNIIILIGPEGGFSEHEVLLASKMGYTSLGLGPRTLRTETASLAVLSIIQFYHGDL